MIRDLVQEILDFKLKEKDFKSYCGLVRLVKAYCAEHRDEDLNLLRLLK